MSKPVRRRGMVKVLPSGVGLPWEPDVLLPVVRLQDGGRMLPYRRFYAALLSGALRDLTKPSDCDVAHRWLRGDPGAAVPLEFACEALGLDADAVLRRFASCLP